MKRYRCEILKITEVDTYKDGCDPNTTMDHGVVHSQTTSSLEHIKRDVENTFQCKLSELESFENRLEFSNLENAAGEPATTFEIDRWKKGKLRLFLAQYSIYMTEVLETEVAASVLKHV